MSATGLELLEVNGPRLRELLNADYQFRRAARSWTCRLALCVDDATTVVSIVDGHVEAIGRSAQVHGPGPEISIHAPRVEWERLLEPEPRPFYHDVMAAIVHHGFRIEGDLADLVAHLVALRRVQDLLRPQGITGHTGPRPAGPALRPRRATISGQYLYLSIDGVEYRVYVEEAGSGIPVLLQHTAVADGRQYRHLLEDPELTSRFRFIVPDLPYHGKSLPPSGLDWWNRDYRLTKAFLIAFVDAVLDGFDIPRAVYLGCSIGGHLAADLALALPHRFAAVIAVQGALKSEYFGPTSFVDHPRIQSPMGPLIFTSMAPTSPLTSKHETAWLYQQGVPFVADGDNHYMVFDHDLTADAHRIDTTKVAVYVMSGDYDRSITRARSRALADAITGSKFVAMDGLGHMAVSEHPELFRRYLGPVLDEIARSW